MQIGVKQSEWIKALESGDYNQYYGGFYNPWENSYCALGVLLACRLDPGKDFGETYLKDKYKTAFKVFSDTGLLGVTGLNLQNQNLSIVCLNDYFKFSFKRIADTLSNKPEAYFQHTA